MEFKDRIDDISIRHRDDSKEPFEPLVVMQFSSKTNQAAVTWMIAKLQASKQNGGANLQVRTMVMPHNSETVLYIGASSHRLILAGELLEIKKLTLDGHYKEISIHDLQSFQGSGNDPKTFFNNSEKQKIIKHEIEGIRAQAMDSNIPGYEKIRLYPGKSIIKKYLSRGLVLQLYPLHDEEEIKRLGDEWYNYKKVFNPQPIDKIRNYFGEKIAVYFAFLGVYTIALIPPALIGIIYLITAWKSVYREAIFAIFNLIWSTLLLEGWKRYCSEISFKWGTLENVGTSFEEPRANYRGELGRNIVTGNPEPVYPKWKRLAKFYFVTVPVISLCLCAAFFVMLLYFWMQAWADKAYIDSGHSYFYLPVLYTPSGIYAVMIAVVNAIYRLIARELNDWENHRLESSYNNHFIVKLVLFDFVNCFMSLFYVAFYLQNRTLLRSHLACLLIASQLMGQIQEAMVPFFFFKRREKQLSKAITMVEELKPLDDKAEEIDKGVLKRSIVEGSMSVYDSTNNDYLELFLQFGYVFLFSSAFPLAALWALLNNVTEIRCDAFKMCRVSQRPFAESASSIGAWQVAFEVIGLMSVITNTALIGMDPTVQALLPSDISAVNMVIIFVIVEHCVLVIKGAVAIFIPDIPKWVELEIARKEYRTKQALQAEVCTSFYL
ncbi:hypothetical protein LOTGIDRAFT_220570 [Lottia gigantea]|uniref:Anoctamin n=1 Tax=Lottia gigantea TaxID=225164 RepID=V3ZVB3_LOTGI|nr:hypothetical protein LOTGIDRAFT_220570 [Lottia gigantea]ESO86525.1 hypothetical protein LOTGIDRAFT_220570 [Lottia gigantea]